jgi:hypothetical protein
MASKRYAAAVLGIMLTSCVAGEEIDATHRRDASASAPSEVAPASTHRDAAADAPSSVDVAAAASDAAAERASLPEDAARKPGDATEAAPPDAPSPPPEAAPPQPEDAGSCPGYAGLSICENCICLACVELADNYRTCEAQPKCRAIIECAADRACSLGAGGCYTSSTCKTVIDAADGPYGTPFQAASALGGCALGCAVACGT